MTNEELEQKFRESQEQMAKEAERAGKKPMGCFMRIVLTLLAIALLVPVALYLICLTKPFP